MIDCPECVTGWNSGPGRFRLVIAAVREEIAKFEADGMDDIERITTREAMNEHSIICVSNGKGRRSVIMSRALGEPTVLAGLANTFKRIQ